MKNGFFETPTTAEQQRCKRRARLGVIAAACALAFACASASQASEVASAENGSAVPAAAPSTVIAPVSHLPKDDYCANIANLAKDARYALQMKTLEDLQKQIDAKIVELEAKRAESEDFLKRQEAAVKKAHQGLVDIFANMKPDVAAAQFELLDVGTSASILRQLSPRAASTILNEMKTPVAAAITVKMTRMAGKPVAGDGI